MGSRTQGYKRYQKMLVLFLVLATERTYIVCILPYKMACCSVMMSDGVKNVMYSEMYVVFHGGVMLNAIALEFMCYSIAWLTAHASVKA